MSGLTGPQKFMLFILILLCGNYVFQVAMDHWIQQPTPPLAEGMTNNSYRVEGFDGSGGASEKENKLYTWISDPQVIYDEFYAGVYDQLSGQTARTQAKVAICTQMWKAKDPKLESWSVLDAGCGTGHACAAFAAAGAGRVVGMDYAPAMLRQAQTKTIPAAKITPKVTEAIRWRQDSLNNPSACAAGEFSHITLFYFTYYYIQDKEQLFRHLNLWTKPGGKLVVEVVNKYKFDPILESASPFVGFSLQKYSKERIRKSKVAFDKFDYEAEFILSDPKAEFYETFRFKNNNVRRQKHEFSMPTMEEVVATGKRAGWKYIGYQDLNPIGFEYGYLLFFEK